VIRRGTRSLPEFKIKVVVERRWGTNPISAEGKKVDGKRRKRLLGNVSANEV